jgi:hypothetical protein
MVSLTCELVWAYILLQSPIARFVRTLAAVPQSFVVVLDQVAKKKEEQGAAL